MPALWVGERQEGRPLAGTVFDSRKMPLSEWIAEGSKIIHDGGKSRNALIEAMGLSSEAHGTDETKGLADSKNPMEPVNEIHRYLSGFAGSHRGFSRDGLQGWFNLFCFYWNTPGDAFQKAQAFIELAVKKRKVLRYRSWGGSEKFR